MLTQMQGDLRNEVQIAACNDAQEMNSTRREMTNELINGLNGNNNEIKQGITNVKHAMSRVNNSPIALLRKDMSAEVRQEIDSLGAKLEKRIRKQLTYQKMRQHRNEQLQKFASETGLQRRRSLHECGPASA